MTTTHDAIRAEVVARYLLGVTEEMVAALQRAAFSPNIKERGDCSTAVFDSAGNVVALPQRVPIHLGSTAKKANTGSSATLDVAAKGVTAVKSPAASKKVACQKSRGQENGEEERCCQEGCRI